MNFWRWGRAPRWGWQARNPQPRRRRAFAATSPSGVGLKVSDISFGSASTSDANLVRYAFERGINFFDTAESYRGGFAEEAIGEALQGKRDRIVLSTKTTADVGDKRSDMMRALERSLKRLGTTT